MTPFVLFEDAFVSDLWPMTLARPAAWITCGAFSLDQLLSTCGLSTAHLVRTYLRDNVRQRGGRLADPTGDPLLFVNAALVPRQHTIERLRELAQKGEPFVALSGQRLTAALCTSGIPHSVIASQGADVVGYLLAQRLPVIDDEFPAFRFPFDVIRWHELLLGEHLERLAADSGLRRIAENVFAGEGCEIASNVVFHADDGPIVIGNHVRIRPFSYLQGPVRIGDHALVIDHAAIKHGAVLGHTVKAGGEIEASILESYSNKQHHGFLGHAYVGSWVNLGAGTSNSDLKNTYGEIAIDVNGLPVASNQQFFGCVIGDYTKTAINTSIFTGKLVGVASFVYGFVTTNVPSFTNYARSFGQVTEVPPDVAIKTQSRVASRRSVTVTAVDQQLLRDLFERTRHERQLSSEQVVL